VKEHGLLVESHGLTLGHLLLLDFLYHLYVM
jgi:hypothetical protein